MGSILPTMPNIYNLGARGATPPFNDTNKAVVGGAHRRRQRKALCKKVSRAEECAEYKGNLSVEKIIEFINDSKELIQDFLPPSAATNGSKNINNSITINRQQIHRPSTLKESRSKKKSLGSKLSISPEAKTISEDSGLRSDVSFADDNVNTYEGDSFDFHLHVTDDSIINKSQSLHHFTTVHHKGAAHINPKASIHNKLSFNDTLDKNDSPSDVSTFYLISRDRSTDSSRRRGTSLHDSLESFTSMRLSTSSSSLSTTDSTSEQYFSLENRTFFLPQQNDILSEKSFSNHEILGRLTNQNIESSNKCSLNMAVEHLQNASNSPEDDEAFTEDKLLNYSVANREIFEDIKKHTRYIEDNIDKSVNDFDSKILNKEIKFGDVPVINSLPKEIFIYSNRKVDKNEKVNEIDINKKKNIMSKASINCPVFFLNTHEKPPSFDTSLNFGFNFNETIKLSQNQDCSNQSMNVDLVSFNTELDLHDTNVPNLRKKTNSFCEGTLLDERPLSMVRPSQRITQPDITHQLLHIGNDECNNICNNNKNITLEQDELLNICNDNEYLEFGRRCLNDKNNSDKIKQHNSVNMRHYQHTSNPLSTFNLKAAQQFIGISFQQAMQTHNNEEISFLKQHWTNQEPNFKSYNHPNIYKNSLYI